METIYYILLTAYLMGNAFLAGSYYEYEAKGSKDFADFIIILFILMVGMILVICDWVIDYFKWLNIITQAQFYFNYLRRKYDAIEDEVFVRIYKDLKNLEEKQNVHRLTFREKHFMYTVSLVLNRNDPDFKKRKSIDKWGVIYSNNE